MKKKRPEALKAAEEACRTLDNEVDDVVRTMQKWPSVEAEVLEWANALTTGNCGWAEYRLAQAILERHRLHERQR